MCSRGFRLVVGGALAALLVAGCSGSGSAESSDGKLEVLASFYPLAFVAEQVGGSAVAVRSLTPAGAEPHDLELSPRQVSSLPSADLVVYLEGFQPAVEEAIEQNTPKAALEVSTVVDLVETAEDEHGHEEEEGEEHPVDPHFWLDPEKMATLASAVGDQLAQVDPDHADDYQANAQQLARKFQGLDAEFEAGLENCQRREIVTSHEAFGYLTGAYRLTQIGISGISPDAEPSPARIHEIEELVREHGVTTIFFETLVSPKLAQTVAKDTGAKIAVLDPVEGITAPDADYFSVMRENLSALRAALGCS